MFNDFVHVPSDGLSHTLASYLKAIKESPGSIRVIAAGDSYYGPDIVRAEWQDAKRHAWFRRSVLGDKSCPKVPKLSVYRKLRSVRFSLLRG